jgi:hypothetical protein
MAYRYRLRMRSQHTHSNKGGSGETRAGWMTAAGMAGEVLMVRRAKGDHPEELRWQADQISCHLVRRRGARQGSSAEVRVRAYLTSSTPIFRSSVPSTPWTDSIPDAPAREPKP